MKKYLFFLMSLLLTSMVINATVPERVGWWKFDDSADLTKATIGTAMVVSGAVTSIDGPATGNLAIHVEPGNYLTINHGIEANGGGTMVNEYTVQIDFSVPVLGLWYAMYQTAPEGDADLFIKTDNTIGASRYSFSTNAITQDTWYRLVVAVKNGDFFKIYINGVLWVDGAGQDVDSRDALLSYLEFFNDDDGEINKINCAEIGIWNSALDATEVAELGSPTSTQTGVNSFSGSALTKDLGQNYPNPFSGITIFNYQVTKTGNVSFLVFNSAGQMIREINQGIQTTGNYQLELNAENLTNGIYYLQMKSNNRISSQKMVVSK